MNPGDIPCYLGAIFLVAIFARILLSWFPLDPDGAMATVAGLLYLITDPVLAPLRRVIPPLRIGNIALDLSAIIVIIGFQIIVLPILC